MEVAAEVSENLYLNRRDPYERTFTGRYGGGRGRNGGGGGRWGGHQDNGYGNRNDRW